MSSAAVHTFLIYSQPDCPWCEKVKALIHERGFPYKEVDLTKLSQQDRDTFKAQFEPKDRTVPKVFLNGTCLGGYEETSLWFKSPMAAELLAPVSMPPILMQRLSPTAIIPTRGTPESIGIDLYADLGISGGISIPPNEIRKVPSGWGMRAPQGHYLRIAPKSGLATKGLDVLAGVVDRDYTGDLTVVLANHNYETVYINHGEKIAQVIAERATVCDLEEVSKLPQTQRGAGGFGSTGA